MEETSLKSSPDLHDFCLDENRPKIVSFNPSEAEKEEIGK